MGADRAGGDQLRAVGKVAQAMLPLWAYHPAAAGPRVHLSKRGFTPTAVLTGCWALGTARRKI